jgi:hypothetical protein
MVNTSLCINKYKEIDMLCDYGCGEEYKFTLKNGKHCCSKRPAGCVILKKINSDGGKKAYETGKRTVIDYNNFSQESKDKMAWARGLDITDPRIKANADANRGKSKIFSNPMSHLGRDNISKGRVKVILEGKYDSSGRKGHRGHYDGVYFHSSWELAFYVYTKETTNKHIVRNSKHVINYIFENITRRYVPDFVLDDNLVEIKSYLHSERDHIKYDQTKDKVEYKFGEDLTNEFDYCIRKYGVKFWETLYE